MPFPGVQWAVGPNRWDAAAAGITALLVHSGDDPVLPDVMHGAADFLIKRYEHAKALALDTPT